MKFEYKVEDATAGKSDGKIYIKLLEGTGTFELKLLELKRGKVVETKIVSDFPLTEYKLVFENLKSTLYVIGVRKENSDCEPTSLSDGMNGILIGTKGLR